MFDKVYKPTLGQPLQYFPRWLAPNLITFIGFLLTIATFLLIGFYDYDFNAVNGQRSTIPNWVWIVASINIFLAYTLGMNLITH